MRQSRGRAFQVERRTNIKATGWEIPEFKEQVGAGVAKWGVRGCGEVEREMSLKNFKGCGSQKDLAFSSDVMGAPGGV